MTKPFPLQTLLDLSQLRMDDAARRLGELLAGEQEASTRLTLLQQYREEYHARYVKAAHNGIGRDLLNNYQTFLGRLDEAIGQAQHMLALSQQRTSQGQQDWMDKRGRVQAYDTLSQRHLGRELGMENRRQQKILDEHSARKYLARSDEGFSSS